MSNTISYYIDKYGSDKNASKYTDLYEKLFRPLSDQKLTLLEIGVGSISNTGDSTFAGNTVENPHYTPGGSLRAWRDYFPNATIYGVDTEEDCKISEERIKTFIFSSFDAYECNKHFADYSIDILIDDGIHTAIGQLYTLYNFFDKVKKNGLYIIEDCGGGGDGTNIFEEFTTNFEKIVGQHEYYFGGNIILIRKTGTGRGRIDTFDEFVHIANISTDLATPENLTVVTGLWDISRQGRDFQHYIDNFIEFLKIPVNMFIYIPKEYEYLVWKCRTSKNTTVRITELEDIKTLYRPFWEQTQKIRTDPKWYEQTGEQGWLVHSPQAVNEWYNPIVQSKMFLLNDAAIFNPFNTEHFVWLDAGITHTVNSAQLVENRALDKIIKYLDKFLFVSYPYETNTEIHGFDKLEIDKLAGQPVKYVCRGGLFGGHKDYIKRASAEYYSMLGTSLEKNLMGTEESIFTIMSYLDPHTYERYELDGSGLIIKFIDALVEDTVKLVDVKTSNIIRNVKRKIDTSSLKVAIYMLTFNFPEQVEHTMHTLNAQSRDWTGPAVTRFLLDNSTTDDARQKNAAMAERWGFTHIILHGNTGINGGRQYAAEHFHNSEFDYYFFFEDDMGLYGPEEGGVCRNGFSMYVNHLYKKSLYIMEKEQFDFLKLSYTEVYMDNNIQVSWYNVPQDIRTRDWPTYDKLPRVGLDPDSPRTKFNRIDVHEGLSYATGEIYYCNWPMVVSKQGNYKMFIETKWATPWEQTWMSYMYQETVKGNINPAVLLASPVHHNRICHYSPDIRREN